MIFPDLSLNGSTVTVQPDVDRTRTFVDADMRRTLKQVLPGQETMFVIPRMLSTPCLLKMEYCVLYNDDTTFSWNSEFVINMQDLELVYLLCVVC